MLKNFIKYFIFVFLLTSCKKCQDCKGNELNGSIESVYNLDRCAESGLPKGEYCIKDTFSFFQLLKSNPAYIYNCDTNNFPINIDFSKYNLLGKYVDNGGCSGKYYRNVIINDENSEVIYQIVSCSKGSCSKNLFSYNFVLVPKFPSHYTVKFESKKYS